MQVYNANTVTDMWKTICDEYKGKTQMVSIDIQRCMMALKAEDGDDIQAHLDGIHLMYEQLVGMNAILSQDDYMTIILGSLPATYSTHLFSLSATAWINSQPLIAQDISAYAIELYDLHKLQPGAPKKAI